MSFYDELGAQLKEAERLLDAEAARAPERPRRRRWLALPRPVALGGLAAVLAAVVFAVVSSEDRTPLAQAGLAILDTKAVAASEVPLSSRERELANARTAHPFETPNGTGYAFLARPANGGVQVCVAIPESPEIRENYPVACAPRAQAEAEGLRLALVGEPPQVAIDVLVLPVGQATARFTPEGGGPSVTLPSVNGVVAFEPPSDGRLSWEGARGRRTEEVTRAFAATKVEVTCRDRTVFYRGAEDIATARQLCREHGGARQVLGVPTTKSESRAKPQNRSRYATGGGTTPTTTPQAPTTP